MNTHAHVVKHNNSNNNMERENQEGRQTQETSNTFNPFLFRVWWNVCQKTEK